MNAPRPSRCGPSPGQLRRKVTRPLRCWFLLAALGWTSCCSLLPAAQSASVARPNIVFFLADDLGYMDIGVNNPKTFYHTPRIDSIAASGIRFTAGYAACPVCSPTRASIMTGKYPARTGITDYIGGRRAAKLLPAPNKDHLALEEVTLAEALRAAGYTNFFAGKWHLGEGDYSPNGQGFGPGLVGKGQFFYPPGDQSPPNPKDDPKTTDRIANAAVRFIDANADRPFFAYLPFLAVHIPIGARQDLIEKYRKDPAPPENWGQEHHSKVRLVQSNPVYAAMLEQLDSAIGRVLEALDRHHLAGRTIVVFMSDNGGLATAEGYPTSNLPLRGGKGWPYEGGIREPWLIRAPGVTRPGSVCDTPVISTDFYPTLLELAGLPLNPKQHCDGVSLVPLLRGGSLRRGPLFWHYPHYGNQGGAPCGAVRDGEWKLIEWYEDSQLELFNLHDDPGEQRNLASTNPDKTAQLQARLATWRKSVNALMPTSNPDFGRKPASTPEAGTGK
jgi:arylsulfatase A-like enzyme